MEKREPPESGQEPDRDLTPSWVQHNTAGPNSTVFAVQGGNLYRHNATGESWAPGPQQRVRILFLAANPLATSRLALDEEAREITEKLRNSRDREAFDLITRWAVRPGDLLQHLNEHEPQIVHFSGHGSAGGEIVLSDGGDSRPVRPAALTELFRIMKETVRVVVLNACWSVTQAQMIGQHIDHVVGMRQPINDRSATIFAASFYSALGFGRTVGAAFDQGRTSLLLHNMPDHDVPQLMSRSGAATRLVPGG